MRRVMIVLCSVCIWASMSFAMQEQPIGNTGINLAALPNFDGGISWDFSNHTRQQMISSKILSYGVLDARLGYINSEKSADIWTAGITASLTRLIYKSGGRITYAWQNIVSIDFGGWLGYDIKSVQEPVHYGIFGIAINVVLNK